MTEVTKRQIRKRAGNRCEYCHLPQDYYDLTFHIEHVIASQHRHDDSASNLALACDRCNLHKGTNLTSLDPESGAVVKLFNPRISDWGDHFDLIGAEIIGLSPVGSTTVRLLQMNSERRLVLRRELLEEGVGF